MRQAHRPVSPDRAGALLVVLGLLGGLTACSGSPSPPGAPSEQIVYRVEDLAGGTARVTTVVAESSPPYRARLVTLNGPPPGAGSLGGGAWDTGIQYVLQPSGDVSVVAKLAPGPSGLDTALDLTLPAAATRSLVRRAGTATVASIACTQWLSKEPLDSAPFAPATATDRTESCVDDKGRLLQDRWTLNGTLVRTRTAVSVGAGPTLDGSALLRGKSPSPAPTDQREMALPQSPQRLAEAFGIAVPAAPEGFAIDASTAVITLDAEGLTRTEAIVFTYRAGRRLVVLRVEQGQGNTRLSAPTGGLPVALSGGRTARISALATGLQLRFLARPGRVTTVTAALDEPTLLRWAGDLTLA